MPHHEHDCNKCTYIGSFVEGEDIMDAYIACHASSFDFIVRYGELGDYITVDVPSRFYPICVELFTQFHKGKH